MHLSDHVAQTLTEFGWRLQDGVYCKRLRGFTEPGALTDGTRVIRLRIDPAGRWLERIDGWHHVERDVDLRSLTPVSKAGMVQGWHCV